MSENKPEYVTDALEMMGVSEPRKIVQEVSGFIPVFEVVMREYHDHMTALVFGRIWNYCNMEDGVCRAKLERIADDLEISTATVMRHIEKLEQGGYILDTTPDRRNRPHVYVDCGKVVMKSQMTATIAQKNVPLQRVSVAIAESQLIKQDKTRDKDLLDAEIHYNQKPTSIRNAIKQYFRLNVNWETKTAREWMQWAVGENITPEQIERAANVWREDKLFNWQPPTLKGVFEKWLLLMSDKPNDIEKTRLL